LVFPCAAGKTFERRANAVKRANTNLAVMAADPDPRKRSGKIVKNLKICNAKASTDRIGLCKNTRALFGSAAHADRTGAGKHSAIDGAGHLRC
jgi:hypothetical protein